MTADVVPPSPEAARHQAERRRYWDAVARESPDHRGWSSYYHRRLRARYQYWVAPGQRVLEVGCGAGDLLAALEPSYGVGIDFSAAMLDRARQRHPHLHFIEADAHEFATDERFDVIVVSDLINDAWDVQAIFERLATVSTPRTRLIINTYSRLWEPLLALAGALGLARPVLHQNWLATADVRGLLALAGFEVVHHERDMLWPVQTPVIAAFVNKFL
ncbi:MAG: class I SAM-dependent methyltransferase, partial [Gemmatimonadota bacterium]|nr:class I SAM-dependent methyltransferase [Gemmatimonadota bacterium]